MCQLNLWQWEALVIYFISLDLLWTSQIKQFSGNNCLLLTVCMKVSGAIIGLLKTSLVGVFPMPYPRCCAASKLIGFSPSGVKNTTVVALNPASIDHFCISDTRGQLLFRHPEVNPTQSQAISRVHLCSSTRVWRLWAVDRMSRQRKVFRSCTVYWHLEGVKKQNKNKTCH